MKKQKILIFGGAGFIGAYLIHNLMQSDEFEVTVVDFSTSANDFFKQHCVRFYHFDITDFSQFDVLKSEKFDAVIHLASTQPANVSSTNYDPRNYMNVNVIGTINVLDYCVKSNSKKLIYLTSHRNTQGLWASFAGKPIKESDGVSVKYNGEYAVFSITETAAQDCVHHYAEKFGLQTMVFRIPPVYGYGPHTRIFYEGKPITTGFQIFIEKARAGEPIEIWGNPDKGRDILYVKDVVNAIRKGIDNEFAKGTYNIASGYKLTLKEEVDVIVDLYWTDKNVTPKITNNCERENGIEEFVYDISKARKELDWQPKFSFKTMLLDIDKEEKEGTFSFLVKKREDMFTKK